MTTNNAAMLKLRPGLGCLRIYDAGMKYNDPDDIVKRSVLSLERETDKLS
jgi:hypothetical protein